MAYFRIKVAHLSCLLLRVSFVFLLQDLWVLTCSNSDSHNSNVLSVTPYPLYRQTQTKAKQLFIYKSQPNYEQQKVQEDQEKRVLGWVNIISSNILLQYTMPKPTKIDHPIVQSQSLCRILLQLPAL